VRLPRGDWATELAARGTQVLTDDVGRSAISRADARQLFDERRESEARKREVMERQEQAAIQADQQFRARLHPGIPWYQVPDGVLPVQAMTQAARDAQPKRRSVLQDALAGGETVMHILEPQPAFFEDE
jgi:hypothetical protein